MAALVQTAQTWDRSEMKRSALLSTPQSKEKKPKREFDESSVVITARYVGSRGPRSDLRYEGTDETFGEDDADDAFNRAEVECCNNAESALAFILKPIRNSTICAHMNEKGSVFATIHVSTSAHELALKLLSEDKDVCLDLEQPD